LNHHHLIFSSDCLFKLNPGYNEPRPSRQSPLNQQETLDHESREGNAKKEQDDPHRSKQGEQQEHHHLDVKDEQGHGRVKPEKDPHGQSTGFDRKATAAISPPKFPVYIEWTGPRDVNVTCAGSWSWSEHFELPEVSPGVYSQVLSLPAGRYEYKLSMDDFWYG
jgi:hypothetical protein